MRKEKAEKVHSEKVHMQVSFENSLTISHKFYILNRSMESYAYWEEVPHDKEYDRLWPM